MFTVEHALSLMQGMERDEITQFLRMQGIEFESHCAWACPMANYLRLVACPPHRNPRAFPLAVSPQYTSVTEGPWIEIDNPQEVADWVAAYDRDEIV